MDTNKKKTKNNHVVQSDLSVSVQVNDCELMISNEDICNPPYQMTTYDQHK